MTVLSKLMAARIALQGMNLKKSGENKFSHYTYFELTDFLPTVMNIFQGLGLCGVVSFTHDLATLTVTSTEDGSEVKITSPMAKADLKGCHEIQNLGACQSYLRRYLWVACMEIVEHDVLDAVTGSTNGKPEPPAPQKEAPKQKKRTASQAVNDLVIASNGDVELAKQRAETVTGKKHSKEYNEQDIINLDKYTATLVDKEDVAI